MLSVLSTLATMAMLGRDLTVTEKYANLVGHADRVFRVYSEFTEVIARTLYILAESRELIAEADATLARRARAA
jgi:hypothetical protein